MNRLSRPTALKIAAAIILVMSLVEIFVYDLPDLFRGAAAVDQVAAANGGPPYIAVLLIFVVSIVGIVAAYGAWRGQKWGVVLVIIVAVLRELDSLAGFLFAPLLTTRILGGVGVVLCLLVIVLCLWRERKPALA
ncbi:MAG TPA: hypothetical protein VF909_10040 [Roseiflexaceae bacterium]